MYVNPYPNNSTNQEPIISTYTQTQNISRNVGIYVCCLQIGINCWQIIRYNSLYQQTLQNTKKWTNKYFNFDGAKTPVKYL